MGSNPELTKNVQFIEKKHTKQSKHSTISKKSTSSKKDDSPDRPTAPTTGLGDIYRFDDQQLALYILAQLDVFENAEPDAPASNTYDGYFYGTTVNDRYCDERRAYFVTHPWSIFASKRRFMTDFWRAHSFRRKVIPSMGRDLHPAIGKSMSKSKERQFTERLSPEIDIFYTKTYMFHERLLGKQFSCITQTSNHCPGNTNLSVKDKVAKALVEYAKLYKSKPQCFSTDKFFPETYVISKPAQCKKFFKFFNSPEYFKLKAERNIVFIRKIGSGVHQGKGVFPVHDDEEKYIRKLYANGTKCDTVKANNIIQSFVHNPLLINNRKFHFRVYMYIASVNPFIVYYHDGYLRISFQQYDTTSKELGAFITNLGMTEILFQDEVGVGSLSNQEIKGESYFFYPQFHKYLTEKGLINDPDWLDTHLRSDMKKAMAHLIRMSKDKFWRKSSVNELYGVDFMMDDDLNLWFIEANSGPLIEGWDKRTKKFFNKLLKDTFEISLGLLRSRSKRIIDYVNELTSDPTLLEFTNEGLRLKDLEDRQQEYKKLTKNYFEPEFEPSPDNGFQLVMDENLKGPERYMGLIEGKCLF